MSEEKTPIVTMFRSEIPVEPVIVPCNHVGSAPTCCNNCCESLKEIPEPPQKSHMMLQLDAGTKAIHSSKYKEGVYNPSSFVTFVKPVLSLIPAGITFTIGNNKYTLGNSVINGLLPAIIPKKTQYTIVNDLTGIPMKLCDDMEFFIVEGAIFTLPKDTIVYHGKTPCKFLEDVKATLCK